MMPNIFDRSIPKKSEHQEIIDKLQTIESKLNSIENILLVLQSRRG